MRELLLTVESGSHCEQPASCLRGRRAQPRVVAERGLAVDLDNDDCPGLATLVAAAEQWRGSARAGEVSLALGAEVRILRGEG
jgi:hypothetical protein